MTEPAFRDNRIVVGVDGSPRALSAALWAAELAASWQADVLLVSALPDQGERYSPAAVVAGAEFETTLREIAQRALDSATEAVRAAQPGVPLTAEVRAGTPADVVTEAADGARMIVLGRSGQSQLRSRLLGSTALHVVNRATCPVTVWTVPLSADGPVVVGVDSGPLSDGAVEFAFEYADFVDAALVAVHTWPNEPLLDPDTVISQEQALLSAALAVATGEHPDVPIVKVARPGSPSEALGESAVNARLVVVGSHGRGTIATAMLGSTSQNLLYQAACPVTIVRR